MVVCAAVKCSNSSRMKQMRFFKFPSEEVRRKVWMTNSGLQNEPGPYAKLCEIHFEENQFELHRQDGWKKLKPNAVPTVFPDPPESPKKTKEKAQKHKRSSSAELDSEIKVPKKKRKKNLASEEDSQTVKRKKSSRKKNASHSSSDGSSKENVSPTRRKGRPRKISNPEPLIDLNADQRSLCPCGNNNSSVKPRVVGGHDAGKGQFPYASCLIDGTWRTEKPIPFCGATLITDSHVVTAAHCIRDRSSEAILVDIGDYDFMDDQKPRLRQAKSIVHFPEYQPGSFHTDIAIIEFEKPVQWRSGVKASWLPHPDLRLERGTMVTVYGWGRLAFGGRRACQTFAVSRASCRRESRLPKQVQYTHRAQHDLRRWTKRP
ncbi:unnamed protein product [Larinioides sclopetarius]|uniref:Uncharacterized protein n=1 Tax=Larinioides sclopetarius TaxID=280406 RepID=A0AAV2B314_9ARAC